MSLAHIKNRREPTIFGKDLNVLNSATIINGNIIIDGTINGTSSQGQETNNVWTGTNTYSVERPTCSLSSVSNSDSVNKTNLETLLSSNSVINKNATWSGANTFTQNVNLSSAILPSASTDAVSGQYLKSSVSSRIESFKSSNNTWTGTNTFTNFIPTRTTNETAPGSAVTKSYVDTSTRDLTVGNAVSYASQSSLSNYNFGTQYLAHQIQIIGGGGGSTSGASGDCSTNFAGVSGGSGVSATLFLLTYSPLAITLGLGTNLGRFSMDIGLGGTGGIGCGSSAPAQNGTPGALYATGASGLGFNPALILVIRANGGFGFNGTCGQSGNTGQAIYTNVNSNMGQPYSKCNGRAGTQNGGEIYQYAGYNKFGAGAAGLPCTNGQQGYYGGYTVTSYEI